ncbi:transposase [Trichonephila clavipes]|nr:transposase [Trichonephila clavipes]
MWLRIVGGLILSSRIILSALEKSSAIQLSLFFPSDEERAFLHRNLREYEDYWRRNLLFSSLVTDEAHLRLNVYVNKQNCRIWSEANPQVYVKNTVTSRKLTVWCALWAGGILLQKNDEGHNVTVNGDRYRTTITNFSFLN